METRLCVTVRFLGPLFHGRREDGGPEWPPSPLRLFQALVAAAAARWNERAQLTTAAPALRSLERTAPPTIIASVGLSARTSYRLYVPDNSGDLVAATWARGDMAKGIKRTEKDVRPTRLPEGDEAVHYVWPLSDADRAAHFETIAAAARSVTHLGWGVDMVAVCASTIRAADVAALRGEVWQPTVDPSAARFRVPRCGTLDALIDKHACFLDRIGPEGFHPVPPLSKFHAVGYQRATEPVPRPFAAFSLLAPDGSAFRPFDTTRRGLTVAGMMRHAASSESLVRSLGWPRDEVAAFILGHGEAPGQPHQPVQGPRLAFLPLPSVESRGTGRADVVGAIRRVLVVAFGAGADDRLNQVARRLSGSPLVAEGSADPVALLSRIPNSDRTVQRYTGPAESWATVTPVVLPGFDDPRKLRKRLSEIPESTGRAPDASGRKDIVARLDRRIEDLLRKAIRQTGFSDQLASSAEIEWRGVGFWPGTEPASRYGSPDSLRCFRRLHVRITWRDSAGKAIPIPGPLCLGGGRFQGLGVFARE